MPTVHDGGRVAEALDTLAESLRADGADLVLEDVGPAAATVRLVVTDETCHECIVSPEILRAIVGDVVRSAVPEILDIEVDDPRVPTP